MRSLRSAERRASLLRVGRGLSFWPAAQWGPTTIGRTRLSTRISPMPASRGSPKGSAANGTGPSFADPLLDGLVDDAVAHNKDLGVAAANLRAARAAGAWRASTCFRP